jgi:hypothetical protein
VVYSFLYAFISFVVVRNVIFAIFNLQLKQVYILVQWTCIRVESSGMSPLQFYKLI